MSSASSASGIHDIYTELPNIKHDLSPYQVAAGSWGLLHDISNGSRQTNVDNWSSQQDSSSGFLPMMGVWICLITRHFILPECHQRRQLSIFFPSQRMGSLAPSSKSAPPQSIFPPRGHHGAHPALHDFPYLQAVSSLPSANALTWFCALFELIPL